MDLARRALTTIVWLLMSWLIMKRYQRLSAFAAPHFNREQCTYISRRCTVKHLGCPRTQELPFSHGEGGEGTVCHFGHLWEENTSSRKLPAKASILPNICYTKCDNNTDNLAHAGIQMCPQRHKHVCHKQIHHEFPAKQPAGVIPWTPVPSVAPYLNDDDSHH